jgi:RNA polymerase sigma-70 factor (ECF subfamily)
VDSADTLYEELIGPIADRMIATVGRIVRHPDDAEDVFQEVQAAIWKNLRKIHRHPNPHAYILRICISRSYDALRRRSRRLKREVPVEPKVIEEVRGHEPQQKVSGKPLRGDTIDSIRNAISRLPAAQGQALLLRAVEDEPYNTIGEIMGCSEATARSHVSKARSRLRTLFEKLGVK